MCFVFTSLSSSLNTLARELNASRSLVGERDWVWKPDAARCKKTHTLRTMKERRCAKTANENDGQLLTRIDSRCNEHRLVVHT